MAAMSASDIFNCWTIFLRTPVGALAQQPPLRRQRDLDLPLVLRAADAGDEADAFQPLEHRRQRAGIEMQPLSDVGHFETVAGPKNEKNEILRVGQPQLVEQRAIGLLDRVRRGVEREAQLVVERERIIGSGIGGKPSFGERSE